MSLGSFAQSETTHVHQANGLGQTKEVVVGEQWVVLGKIGEGSFGEVFKVRDIQTRREYAIKREARSTKNPQLEHEADLYDILAGGTGIPACHWFGREGEYNCIVLDLLGPSVKSFMQSVKGLRLKCVVDIGVQIVSILQHIHSQGLVYRDVKPENFLFHRNFQLPPSTLLERTDFNTGFTTFTPSQPICDEWYDRQGREACELHVVDFGLATWWRNPTTGKALPESHKRIRHKTGTARYASLNVHQGREHSRRDDIESVAYLLLDLLLGNLPWSGVKARNSRIGWERMREIKEDMPLSELCAGLPIAFQHIVEYARELSWSQDVDYDWLRQKLRNAVGNGPDSKIVGDKDLYSLAETADSKSWRCFGRDYTSQAYGIGPNAQPSKGADRPESSKSTGYNGRQRNNSLIHGNIYTLSHHGHGYRPPGSRPSGPKEQKWNDDHKFVSPNDHATTIHQDEDVRIRITSLQCDRPMEGWHAKRLDSADWKQVARSWVSPCPSDAENQGQDDMKAIVAGWDHDSDSPIDTADVQWGSPEKQGDFARQDDKVQHSKEGFDPQSKDKAGTSPPKKASMPIYIPPYKRNEANRQRYPSQEDTHHSSRVGNSYSPPKWDCTRSKSITMLERSRMNLPDREETRTYATLNISPPKAWNAKQHHEQWAKAEHDDRQRTTTNDRRKLSNSQLLNENDTPSRRRHRPRDQDSWRNRGERHSLHHKNKTPNWELNNEQHVNDHSNEHRSHDQTDIYANKWHNTARANGNSHGYDRHQQTNHTDNAAPDHWQEHNYRRRRADSDAGKRSRQRQPSGPFDKGLHSSHQASANDNNDNFKISRHSHLRYASSDHGTPNVPMRRDRKGS